MTSYGFSNESSWPSDVPIEALLLDYCETGIEPSRRGIRRIHDHAHELNVYPRALSDEARRAIAREYGVSDDSVLLTSGVDEATDLILQESKSLTCVTPGFFGFWDRAQALGVPIFRIPLTADWQLPDDWTNAPANSGFLVAQPNNPTGSYFQDDEWLESASGHFSLVMVDETYQPLADPPRPTVVGSVPDNVLTYISFSKAYGMAGLRVGALIGDPTSIGKLASRCRFHSVGNISLHAVIGTLEDLDAVQTEIERFMRLRSQYASNLREKEHLFRDVRNTNCTFVICQPKRSAVRSLVAGMSSAGIRIADCKSMGLDGWIRIGVADELALMTLDHALSALDLEV